MEQLLHYVFKHKLFPLRELKTSDGEPVEVIDPGLHNHNAGPDFFNAKIKNRTHALGRERRDSRQVERLVCSWP